MRECGLGNDLVSGLELEVMPGLVGDFMAGTVRSVSMAVGLEGKVSFSGVLGTMEEGKVSDLCQRERRKEEEKRGGFRGSDMRKLCVA